MLPAIGCGACDTVRGILCLSCYSHADDPGLPSPYAEYFAGAAGYPRSSPRPRPISRRFLALSAVAATALAYVQIGPVRAELDGLRARAAVIRDPMAHLRQTTSCIDQAFSGDFGLALERASRGEQVGDCTTFER